MCVCCMFCSFKKLYGRQKLNGYSKNGGCDSQNALALLLANSRAGNVNDRTTCPDVFLKISTRQKLNKKNLENENQHTQIHLEGSFSARYLPLLFFLFLPSLLLLLLHFLFILSLFFLAHSIQASTPNHRIPLRFASKCLESVFVTKECTWTL